MLFIAKLDRALHRKVVIAVLGYLAPQLVLDLRNNRKTHFVGMHGLPCQLTIFLREAVGQLHDVLFVEQIEHSAIIIVRVFLSSLSTLEEARPSGALLIRL